MEIKKGRTKRNQKVKEGRCKGGRKEPKMKEGRSGGKMKGKKKEVRKK